jgi:hypothetical protein
VGSGHRYRLGSGLECYQSPGLVGTARTGAGAVGTGWSVPTVAGLHGLERRVTIRLIHDLQFEFKISRFYDLSSKNFSRKSQKIKFDPLSPYKYPSMI